MQYNIYFREKNNSCDAFTDETQIKIRHMTSSSRLTGYPWVLVTICHRRGYSCSCRLSPKPRGGSTKCTNFFVMIIYNMELPIHAKGEWKKMPIAVILVLCCWPLVVVLSQRQK